MNKLLFGTAGIPCSTPKPSDTIKGIEQVKKLGLDTMELEFVRSINIKEDKAEQVRSVAKKNEVVLTCHGQYFVNLNAHEKSVLEASKKRIIDACKIADKAGVWSICYHMAYYMKDAKKIAYEQIKKAVKEILQKLENNGINIWLRPETGGKLSQFGEIDELIKLSQDFQQVLPCIDWAHHYSRSLGKINSYERFREIAIELEKHLGRNALDNMHCHMEGIEYTDKGEKNHVNLKDCPIDYKAVVKVWKEFKMKGVITCESPNIEEDALLLKKTYENN
ncbi:TIM barrel protein [Candidatus Woesearchaeota archaeon]|nr:TIM barrel protein [Candidatus Woesearchaeota archaeon]